MATRRDETVSVKKKSAAPASTKAAPAKKAAAPRKRAAARKAPAPESIPAKKAAAPSEPAGAKGLLRAGLQALGNVRDDVVKRQTNVIESLLGMGKAEPSADGKPAPARFPGLDTFGIRKFEDVFDQRVATSLQRLGMPSAEEIKELREQMRQVLEHLERAEAARRKR
ncbi:phasin family protein [Variovorax sp. J22R24]|uniref:phasin family protein n=1 Tax=Variovorax gracilis TaxID=3053502 RepID=UPI0025774975|nr:phasin family protein [Variovorax sp. J22R24]MDM0106717.1 phasin family protein [Variovorax sp. J22R24]